MSQRWRRSSARRRITGGAAAQALSSVPRYGWGMSIKLAGCSTLLVRAVEMDGTEVGMTAWAQMTASLLGMSDTLCVGRSDTLAAILFSR